MRASSHFMTLSYQYLTLITIFGGIDMKFKNYLLRIASLWSALGFLMLTHFTSEAAFIPVGAGGYTTDLPAGSMVPSDRNNQPVTPKSGPGLTKPPQTNDWWTSILWRYNPETAWSENLLAHPLSCKAQAAGLE